jgi:hypothetical protein
MSMTNAEAAKILTDHNEWRRGGEGEQMSPILIGEAIELAVAALGDASFADDSEE